MGLGASDCNTDLERVKRRYENNIPQLLNMKAVHSVRTFRINNPSAQRNNLGDLNPQCIQSTEKEEFQRRTMLHIQHTTVCKLEVLPIDIKVLAVKMHMYFNIHTVHVAHLKLVCYFATAEYKQLCWMEILNSFSSFCFYFLLLPTGRVSNCCKQAFFN
jgi:hypothetical protein